MSFLVTISNQAWTFATCTILFHLTVTFTSTTSSNNGCHVSALNDIVHRNSPQGINTNNDDGYYIDRIEVRSSDGDTHRMDRIRESDGDEYDEFVLSTDNPMIASVIKEMFQMKQDNDDCNELSDWINSKRRGQ